MSQCSKELDLIFDELCSKAKERNQCDELSNEWEKLDKECTVLYHRAESIFKHYNPDFHYEEKLARGKHRKGKHKEVK